ncbi:hypothetical protein H1230_13260 [Paenibacillus sp. 19GGS1-52]|uniref:hypothetical protein n=1 Tax=Paenibacillus sp. 19GGS1-52 TaxID=2758563 RepID=UPI001EFA4822|nr:hypothetical protein [Paenibacillus sp. 19GGS1-52]ULO09649.1 hypothetical protein H1230_13260 [Paenibacillus sp. 19GGS1-52]
MELTITKNEEMARFVKILSIPFDMGITIGKIYPIMHSEPIYVYGSETYVIDDLGRDNRGPFLVMGCKREYYL